MGKGYLIDTNAVIDYLDNKLPANTTSFIDDLQVQISVVSRIELLAWPNISQEQHALLTRFINAAEVVALSESVILKTIELKKTYRVKLPDAIIAATAIVNNWGLLTRNVNDFEKIDGLLIMNPYKMK
ncbi:MAG: type II toxin-antitoxin system VapC family toxin [Sphingobacteriales bacterium]